MSGGPHRVVPSTPSLSPPSPAVVEFKAAAERKRLRLSICRMISAGSIFLLYGLVVVAPKLHGYNVWMKLPQVLLDGPILITGLVCAFCGLFLWIPWKTSKTLVLLATLFLSTIIGGWITLNVVIGQGHFELVYFQDGPVWIRPTYIGYGAGGIYLLLSLLPMWWLYLEEGSSLLNVRPAPPPPPPPDPAEFEVPDGWDEVKEKKVRSPAPEKFK